MCHDETRFPLLYLIQEHLHNEQFLSQNDRSMNKVYKKTTEDSIILEVVPLLNKC